MDFGIAPLIVLGLLASLALTASVGFLLWDSRFRREQQRLRAEIAVHDGRLDLLRSLASEADEDRAKQEADRRW